MRRWPNERTRRRRSCRWPKGPKPSYGAFHDTPLETILRKLRRDTILVTGTLTNFCCGSMARQGYERGFFVVFGSDVTATDDADLHEAELKVLRMGFARVLTAARILGLLERNEPSSTYRSTSPVVGS